ncbi:DUF488 domain-containing protein [Ravibacter arvi]|uniref:DUF488 domain-containing protein n=1 Tax=Ravibacter arvi TaxID=2051041 RepID=A0ABP8LR32_9BACT
MKPKILTKRIYLDPSPEDGYRILIDRLWPRGVSKERAKLDWWGKELAPSTSLREWYHHAPELRKEFAEKYLLELDKNPAKPEWRELLKKQEVVTLLYATKDPALSQATVLKGFLEDLAR